MLRVNLLPEEERKSGEGGFSLSLEGLPRPGDLLTAASDPWGLALAIAAVAVLLTVGGSWYLQARHADQLEEGLTAAVEDSARLADLRAMDDSLRAQREEIERRLGLVARLDRDRFAWARMIHALAAALPEPAWLARVEAERPLPELRLRVEGAAADPLAVTSYARELEGYGWIAGTTLEGTSRLTGGPAGSQSFVLTVDYRPPGRAPGGS